MSADNGIYLLKSPKDNADGFEYRVIFAQAIDNIYWNEKTNEEGHEPDPKSLINYFGKCEVFEDSDKAHNKAFEMEREILSDGFCFFLEYGISTIEIPKPFSWYREKAKENNMKAM